MERLKNLTIITQHLGSCLCQQLKEKHTAKGRVYSGVGTTLISILFVEFSYM